MVLVFTLLSKHVDQNPEARVPLQEPYVFLCPGTDQFPYWLLSSEFL